MRYLLDTNVVSEGARPNADAGLARWLREQSPLDLAISVLSLGEIRNGVDLLAPGKRRDALEGWLMTELPRLFSGRVLPVDDRVADVWGRLTAQGRCDGRPLPAIDGLLLATASVRGLTLVSRNERDCAGRGVPVLNPWTS